MGFLLLGLLPPPTDRPTDRRPTDRPTDRPPPRSELLLAPPLSFFYTHTRHTHVDSLTHTRQTHTRSLTVPFAHGARVGASLDTHTVDAHTFAHGARARHTLGSLAARFCWQGQHFRLWTVPERVSGPPPLDAARRSTWEPRGSFLLAGAALQALDGARARFGPPPLMLPGAALGSLAARFCWQGQHFRLWTVPERVSGPPLLMQHLGASRLVSAAGAALQALDARARFGAPRLWTVPSAFRGPPFCWQGQHFRLWTVPERVSGPPPSLDAARRSTWFGPPPP